MVITSENLREYFQEHIRSSCEQNNIYLSYGAEDYLCNLLVDSTSSDRLFTSWKFDHSSGRGLEPITFKLAKALHLPSGSQRNEHLRSLGDHCVFLLGWFMEYLQRHGEGMIRYHQTIGKESYRLLSDAMITSRRSPLFRELADHFDDLTRIVDDLHLPALDNPAQLAEVLRRWELSGKDYYARLLQAKGVNTLLMGAKSTA